MHYDVSYKDKDSREAVLDLVKWAGFKRSLIVARGARQGWPKMVFEFSCEFIGVRGYPVKAAWERWNKR